MTIRDISSRRKAKRQLKKSYYRLSIYFSIFVSELFVPNCDTTLLKLDICRVVCWVISNGGSKPGFTNIPH